MYGRVLGITVVGVRGRIVTVEAHIGRGLPSLTLTGLPGAAVQDARERIRPAVESAGLEWPLRRVVVNLAPGNLRKDGPGLDLPVAMGILAASRQVPATEVQTWAFVGELSLRGGLVATPGVLSAAIATATARLRGVVVPDANAAEAALVGDLQVVGASSLGDVVRFFRGAWKPILPQDAPRHGVQRQGIDLAEVCGQAQARRALEIAAAGGHNLLLRGAPGAGKTMLARRLPSILPTMSREESLEVTQLHSVAGILDGGLIRERPFRAPHHTISPAALLGGGTGSLRPGEVSLAHHGVLFLDEFTEFRRDALEGLRQPLEDGRVVVSRMAGAVEFPARFTLAAAANPCPCGFADDPVRSCSCREDRAQAYAAKLSGPLLDRVDIALTIPRLTKRDLLSERPGETSAAVRERVEAARARQRERYRDLGFGCNAQLPGPIARRVAAVSPSARDVLASAVEVHALTGRGFDRALKVARTIADLAGASTVLPEHAVEALAYRAATSRRELERAG